MQFQIISCEMLEKYLKRSDILLLDLRSKEDYEKDHILPVCTSLQTAMDYPVL